MTLSRLLATGPARWAVTLLALACGPLGPLPGGALRGEEVSQPVRDWSFAADVETVQLETRPEDPHSVTVWCGVHEGALYVATSLILGADEPTERSWVRHVQADPHVRMRIAGRIYRLRAVRVEDPAEREAARAVLIAKYDVHRDEHAEQAWVYRMESR